MSVASSCCSDLREINEAKVTSILSYLDDVANPQAVTMGTDTVAPGDHSTGLGTRSGAPPSLSSSFAPLSPLPKGPISFANRSANGSVASGITTLAGENQVYCGIKGKIDALRSTCETLRQENNALQKKIIDDRGRYDRSVQQVRDAAKHEIDEAMTQLRKAHKEQSDAVSRITKERDVAQRACEELTHRLKMETSRKSQEMDTLQAAHVAAIQKMKEELKASDKKARETWKEQMTDQMKKECLRLLQPDIEAMVTRHRAEKVRLEEAHRDALQRRDQVMAEKEKLLDDEKEKVRRNAEERIGLERQLADDRCREEISRMRRVMEEERSVLEKKREAQQAVFDERERTLKMELTKVEEELADYRRKLAEGTMQFRDAVSSEVHKVSAAQEAQTQAHKQRLSEENAILKRRLETELEATLKIREDELRAKCKLELDRMVAATHEKMEETYLTKVREMKESDRMVREKIFRLERTIQHLENELELTKGQLSSAMETLRQKDEAISALRSDMQSARDARDAAEAVASREFDHRLHALNSQWQSKLHQLENDKVESLQVVRQEHRMSELAWNEKKAELEAELRAMDQKYNSELSAINDKVLVTVAAKDGAIQQLQLRLAQYEAQLKEKDAWLEQHRALLAE